MRRWTTSRKRRPQRKGARWRRRRFGLARRLAIGIVGGRLSRVRILSFQRGSMHSRNVTFVAFGAFLGLFDMLAPGFAGGFFPGSSGQPLPELQRNIVVKRAGMRLLIVDAQLWQHVDNDIRLDFQFACQLVNSNLAHR